MPRPAAARQPARAGCPGPQLHVPGQDLQPVQPVAVPVNILGGDADLAVLAHGPGHVRAFHRDIGQRQGQIVPGNPEGPGLPDEPRAGARGHGRGDWITWQGRRRRQAERREHGRGRRQHVRPVPPPVIGPGPAHRPPIQTRPQPRPEHLGGPVGSGWVIVAIFPLVHAEATGHGSCRKSAGLNLAISRIPQPPCGITPGFCLYGLLDALPLLLRPRAHAARDLDEVVSATENVLVHQASRLPRVTLGQSGQQRRVLVTRSPPPTFRSWRRTGSGGGWPPSRAALRGGASCCCRARLISRWKA